jgi:hypothetical protein
VTQVIEKPPHTPKNTNTGSRFYLLAVSKSPMLYWEGQTWSTEKASVKAFPSYDAAELVHPLAVKKAPAGAMVIISPDLG